MFQKHKHNKFAGGIFVKYQYAILLVVNMHVKDQEVPMVPMVHGNRAIECPLGCWVVVICSPPRTTPTPENNSSD